MKKYQEQITNKLYENNSSSAFNDCRWGYVAKTTCETCEKTFIK